MLSSRIFSSHVVSFLLFVSRPADIPDNSFPTPFPTWLPISRCNCHLREDLSIGLNARPFLCVREERPHDLAFAKPAKFPSRLLCTASLVYTQCLENQARDLSLKNYFILWSFRDSNSKVSIGWIDYRMEIMVAYIRTYPGNIHLLNCKYTKCFLLKGH